MDHQAFSPVSADASGPTSDGDGKRISSATLFGERREVVILHNGREYRLRLTQNDKLILTA